MFNLNLLRALNALLGEQSVSNAAYACEVTQSAMSVSLRKLREHFNDPLLVKDSRGKLILSELANKLSPIVHNLLLEVDNLLKVEVEFDPKTTEDTIRIGMSDYLGFRVLPKLVNHLSEVAPKLKIVHVAVNHFDSLSPFQNDHLDFIIGNFDNAPESLFKTALFEDKSILVMDKNHPLADRAKFSTEEMCRYPQIFVSLEKGVDDNLIAQKLINMGHTPIIKLITPHTLLPLQCLPATNMITNTVESLAKPFCESLGLKVKPTPYSMPNYKAFLYWQVQHKHSQLHLWFRDILREQLAG